MTAEELLMMSDDVEAYSTDDALVIDAENRIILTPAGGLLLGVESDEESERIKFICPRIVGDNIDLSTLQLRAIYKNANGDKDSRICTDITIDGSYIRFSWLLSRKVTRYKGTVKFIICAIRTQSDGSIKNEWNTTLAEGKVLEGLEVDISEEEFEEPKDIVLQLLGMLDEKASDISDAIESQKAEVIAEIKAEEARVMKTIPEDYTYVYNLAEENKQLKANAIKRTYSGETIVATDSSQAKFEGLRVFGRSEQVSTTGKNLFDEKQKEVGTIRPEDGIEAVDSNFYRTPYLPITAGAHTFSAKGTFSNIVRFFWYDSDKNFLSYSESRQGALEVPENTGYYRARWILSDDVTEMMLNKGDLALPYEPYTGGKPSPSPDYPQTIESVGDDGSVGVGVYGKNLINYPYNVSNGTVNGITYTTNSDGSITLNGTAEERFELYIKYIILPEGEYKINGCPKGGSSSNYGLSIFYNGSKHVRETGEGLIFTITSDGSAYKVRPYIVVNKGITVSNLTFHPMIRIASVSNDTYEPYKPKQSLEITTPNGLPGIKVTDASLATYTDAEGVMWVADEIDFARGKYVQRVGELNTRDLHWIINRDWTNASETCAIAYTTRPTNMRKNEIVSTHFRNFYSGNANLWQVGLMGVEKNNVLYASIPKELASTRDEFQEYMTDLSATVRYVLIEPMETDLTAEQLEAYRALHSNYPTTTILNDENAHMEVTLVADTKNHIEQNYVPKSEFLSVVDRVLAVEQALV